MVGITHRSHGHKENVSIGTCCVLETVGRLSIISSIPTVGKTNHYFHLQTIKVRFHEAVRLEDHTGNPWSCQE